MCVNPEFDSLKATQVFGGAGSTVLNFKFKRCESSIQGKCMTDAELYEAVVESQIEFNLFYTFNIFDYQDR